MSRRSVLTSLLFVAIAFASYHASDRSLVAKIIKQVDRQPASIDPMEGAQKDLAGTFRAAPVLRHTEKVHGPIDVKLELIGPAPTQAGDIFVLRGLVDASQNLERVRFKWAIPPGVRLLSGPKVGDLTQVQAGEPVVLEITLQKVTNQNEQIHLHAETAMRRNRFGDVAQFNTDIHDIVDSSHKVLGKSALEESDDAHPRKHLKVYQ